MLSRTFIVALAILSMLFAALAIHLAGWRGPRGDFGVSIETGASFAVEDGRSSGFRTSRMTAYSALAVRA